MIVCLIGRDICPPFQYRLALPLPLELYASPPHTWSAARVLPLITALMYTNHIRITHDHPSDQHKVKKSNHDHDSNNDDMRDKKQAEDSVYVYGYGHEAATWHAWYTHHQHDAPSSSTPSSSSLASSSSSSSLSNTVILMTSDVNNANLSGGRLLDLNPYDIPSLLQQQRDHLSFTFNYLRAYNSIYHDRHHHNDSNGSHGYDRDDIFINWTCGTCYQLNDMMHYTCVSCAAIYDASYANTKLIRAVQLPSSTSCIADIPHVTLPSLPSSWRVCIIYGGNSSGKSTLLRRIAGVSYAAIWCNYRAVISHFASPAEGEEALMAVGIPYHIM